MSPLEIDNCRWDAVRRRDDSASFIFAVRTTRVACRPGCPSPTPRRENTRFFEDFDRAQAAGFRACKRCAPHDVAAGADRQRLVARACALIDADEGVPLADISRELGVSRFHFQRLFRDVLHVTPGEYRRARREERLRAWLADGRSVTDAIHAAGYGSPSRAYEANPLGMTPTAYRSGGAGERIAYAIADSSLGRVLVARTVNGICAIALADDDERLIAEVRVDFPRAEIVEDDDDLRVHLEAVLAQIDAGDAAIVDLDIRGTVFQRRVWNALRAIPPGERWSYTQLANAIGRPDGARAVAAACADNRLAVAVPCHRVVGADGSLKGYRWGVARKAALLKRESDRTR